MSAIEQVAGFHTIVLDLATAQLLETLIGTVEHRRTVRGLWVHRAWPS